MVRTVGTAGAFFDFVRAFTRAFAYPFRAEPFPWMVSLAIVAGPASCAPRYGDELGLALAGAFLCAVTHHSTTSIRRGVRPRARLLPLLRVAAVLVATLGPGLVLLRAAHAPALATLAFGMGGTLLPAMLLLASHAPLDQAFHPRNVAGVIRWLGVRYGAAVLALGMVAGVGAVLHAVAVQIHPVPWIGPVLAWLVGIYPAFVGARVLGVLAR